MSQHTPGPWNLHPKFGKPVVGIDVQDGGPLIPIAEEVQGYDMQQARANARLIAAAPDLLDALLAEQEWRAREADGEIDPEWNYERMVGDKRRAAIAKAEGAQ